MAVVVGIFALLYPVIVYWGLSNASPNMVAIPLIIILGLRFKFTKLPIPNNAAKLLIAVIICLLLMSFVSNKADGILLYPVIISAGFFCFFVYSLFSPPSVIERIARIKEPHLPASGIQYTRKVTIAWSVFFLLNGVIAAYTTFFCDLEIWTLYNGFLSYCLMALFGACEWLIRQRVRR